MDSHELFHANNKRKENDKDRESSLVVNVLEWPAMSTGTNA